MSAAKDNETQQNRTTSDTARKPHQTAQQKSEARSNLMYSAIVVLFLVVAAITVIWRSNIIQKSATAATIDEEKYTASEVSFYYQNAYYNFVNNYSYLISYFGLDTSLPLEGQPINETAAAMLGLEVGGTWHDYFLEQALNQIATIQTALNNAEAEGFTYSAGVQAQYDDSMAALKSVATASGLSTNQYLKNNFSSTMSEKVYSAELMRMFQFDDYMNAHMDSLTYTDEQMEEIYAADPNSYDKVSYKAVMISGTAESTTNDDGETVEPTEEEIAIAKGAAKDAADKMLRDYKASSSSNLASLADAYGDGATYSENAAMAYSGDALTEWLFATERQSGDSAVIESGSNYYVAVFNERYREEYETIDVRHILIQPAAGELSEDDEGYEDEQAQLKADAKAQADDILAQWQAGEATEDTFAQLAMEHSVDGSKYVGGLYTRVYQGQMVTTFEDWCFDSSRQVGDTGIVETPYGYHVMYFSGKNLPYWQTMIASTLEDEEYGTWYEGLSANSQIQQHDFGMKFVG